MPEGTRESRKVTLMTGVSKRLIVTLGILALLALSSIYLLTLSNRTSAAFAMPRELFRSNPDFRPGLVANTATEESAVAFDSYLRKVIVFRWKRTDPTRRFGPDDVESQALSVSFDISSITVAIDPVPRVDSLYVAGTDPSTGASRIEHWKFSYGAGPGGLDEAPTETRTTLFSGTSLGYIRSICVDHRQRLLVVLAYDGGVYRLDIPQSGGAGSGGREPTPPILLYDPAVIPQLAQARDLDYYLHKSDGYMFLIHLDGADTDIESRDTDTIVIPDADGDGELEPAVVYSASTWDSSGYSNLANYVPLYKTEWFPDFGPW